ncbi:hypothetical protein KCU67_g12756, partial [Aureobasidium melanogenum]
LEWILCFILKPSWSWTKDMLKRVGKQTVEWLDELWIVEGTSKHEVLADAKADGWADLEDTDDNWSMCVDTPSETGSNATSRSTNTVPTDRKKSRRVSFSDTVDTASNQEAVASYVKALNQLLVPQDRSKRHGEQQQAEPGVPTKRRSTADLCEPSSTTTQQPESSKPKTSKHNGKQASKQPVQNNTVEDLHMSSSQKTLSNHKQSPKPKSSSKQRVEHQPAEIIIVEVRKGTTFEEKLVVRMYRTSSFSSLKCALNSDELGDDTHGLAIKDDEGGYYPVFDNDTPISVNLQHWATLFWVPTPIVPKSLDLTEDIEMDYGHSRRKPSGNARRY